ncbi:MAG: glycosyltransferase family 39 protein [Patescibacteria group bacterium]|nr:glycosyltransferase family 39 protein [Patescibacteria group bacterium]
MTERFTSMFHNKRAPLGLLAALAVAFLLGLPHLGSEQLWFDEVLGLTIYRHPVNVVEMTTYLAQNENHPPLWYYLMAGWTWIFSDSPLAIRFFSVLCTVLAVGLLYGLARRWFNRRTATIAALLCALSPMSVEFSREARPYALLTVLAVASWFAFSRWLDASGDAWRRRAWLCAFAILTLAGLYTHYAYIFLFGSQLFCAGLYLGRAAPLRVESGRVRRREFFAAVFCVLVGYAPWLPVIATNLSRQYFHPDTLSPLADTVMPVNFLPLDVLFNFLFFPAKWPVDALGRVLQGSLVILLVIVVGLALADAWRRYRTQSADVPGSKAVAHPTPGNPTLDHFIILFLWLLVPPLLLLFSPISGRYSWYYARHLLVTLPALCLISALGIDYFLRWRVAVLPTTMVAVICSVAFFSFSAPQYFSNDSRWDPQHQFADLTAYIASQDGGGRELIVGFWPDYRILLDYYYRGRQTVGSLVPRSVYSNQLEIVSGAPRQTAVEGYLLTHPNIPYERYRLPDALAQYDRIWVVSVVPTLYDLDIALAHDGFQPTSVELPAGQHGYLFRFDRLNDRG